jgi:benzoylformate decarboxylase
VGDGSMQYSVQTLWTAVQYNIPAIFVVLRNGDYSALKSFCDFTSVGQNVPGVNIPGIDIVKIAQGYGMCAREIDRVEDLEPAFQEAFAAQAPRLISVNIQTTGKTCMGMDLSVNPPNYG